MRLPVRLCTEDLILSEEDVATFLDSLGAVPVSRAVCSRIFAMTEGWIMGVGILGADPAGPDADFGTGSMALRVVCSYIMRVVQTLPMRWHRDLFTLAWLDEVPAALALPLTSNGEVRLFLDGLGRQGFFVRCTDDVFTLHPMVRQALRDAAADVMPAEDVQAIVRRAGRFWAERGDVVRAVKYFTAAGDYDAMETLLQRQGAVVRSVHCQALDAVLNALPAMERDRRGWILLVGAVVKLDREPAVARCRLNSALHVFRDAADRVGELLCLAHLMILKIITDGEFRDGENMLERASELFFEISGDLDDHHILLVARSLAVGNCIYVADQDEACRFAALGLGLAQKLDWPDFEAFMYVVWGYIQIFAGNTMLARHYLEKAYQCLYRQGVGLFTQLLIRMMLFNFSFHYGDFSNYFRQKNELVAAVGQDRVDQSIAGPFCQVWEMDIAITRGRLADVTALADRTYVVYPDLTPHLERQVLQLLAVAVARDGQEQAMVLNARATELCAKAGGRYFVTLNAILSGHVMVLLGQLEPGMEVLQEGIERACAMKNSYLEACGRLHKAEGWILAGMWDCADRELAAGLRLMQRNDYAYFWCWAPAAMRVVFSRAVAMGIETEYVRALAAQRLDCAVTDDGHLIPFLEIRALGGLEFFFRGESILRSEELTPAQRELLGLLLCSAQCKISADTLCVHLWPDSSGDSVRAKCDTIVSRLRKVLESALPGRYGFMYVARGRGMIWLEHCRVDVDIFSAHARKGLMHLQLQEFWQARNELTQAHAIWGGALLPEVQGSERLHLRRDSLAALFVRVACALADLVLPDAGPRAAMDILEKAMDADPLNEKLYAAMYRFASMESLFASRHVLRRFEDALTKDGYSAGEIQEFMETFTASVAH